jgi:hypothetical protein
MAGLQPIAKRCHCENLLNSHNQFLKIVHYVAASTSVADWGASDPVPESMC